jgi:hypothetical protein
MLPSILANVPVSNLANPLCSQLTRLWQAIAQAALDVEVATADQIRVHSEHRDIEPYSAALREARRQARLLVATLNQHRKEHGC